MYYIKLFKSQIDDIFGQFVWLGQFHKHLQKPWIDISLLICCPSVKCIHIAALKKNEKQTKDSLDWFVDMNIREMPKMKRYDFQMVGLVCISLRKKVAKGCSEYLKFKRQKRWVQNWWESATFPHVKKSMRRRPHAILFIGLKSETFEWIISSGRK